MCSLSAVANHDSAGAERECRYLDGLGVANPKGLGSGFLLGEAYHIPLGRDRFRSETVLYNHHNLDVHFTPSPGGGVHIVGLEVEPISRLYSNATASACTGDSKTAQLPNFPRLAIRNASAPLEVTWTYSVRWRRSQVPWRSRWDESMRMWTPSNVHWLSLVNSCTVVGLLLALLSVAFRRTMARSRLRTTDPHSAQTVPSEEEVRSRAAATAATRPWCSVRCITEQYRMWRAIMRARKQKADDLAHENLHRVRNDVFRPPNRPVAFAVCLAVSLHACGAALVVLLWGAAGWLSIDQRTHSWKGGRCRGGDTGWCHLMTIVWYVCVCVCMCVVVAVVMVMVMVMVMVRG